jgi:hypothetical protein
MLTSSDNGSQASPSEPGKAGKRTDTGEKKRPDKSNSNENSSASSMRGNCIKANRDTEDG